MKYWILLIIVTCAFSFVALSKKENIITPVKSYIAGEKIDSLNGVYVHYNGRMLNVSGRNIAPDGYNLGLKYQCVEFVKRYYYYHLGHKMPNTYGHAKDFFDKSLTDGSKNKKRNLYQYTNASSSKPQVNDLLIFDGTQYNQYGHVAIISKVTDSEIEVIQQNTGSSRNTYDLYYTKNKWKINSSTALGWLRKN